MGFLDKVMDFAEKSARTMDKAVASDLEKSYRRTSSYGDRMNSYEWQRELDKQERATRWLEKRGKL